MKTALIHTNINSKIEDMIMHMLIHVNYEIS